MNHRTIPRLLFITLCLFLPNLAISGEALNESAPVITERGPHHSVWSWIVPEQLPDGNIVNRTHSYTEMASGLNYWSDEQKDWLPSTEDVEIINGAAVARHGAMQVIWTANPNVAGAVDLQTAEGLRFQSHILGIAFTDAKTGASAFIANLKDCVGEVSGNSVIYRNAFDSIAADIIYVYKRGSFEQNILLKEALPDPTQPPWNMDPSTVRVEIFTEFIDPPQAEVTTLVLKQESDPAKRQFMAEPDLTDDQLNFGASIIGRGTAFLTGLPGDAENLPVAKVFEVREKNRHVLVERVEHNAIMAQMGALPRAAAVTRERMAKVERSRDKRGIPKLSLPQPLLKAAKLKSKPMRMAQLSSPAKGFLIDYTLLTAISGAVLRGDQTYYVSGQVTLSTPATFEGGVVIKYAPTNTSSIRLTGATTFLSSPYRMIHLTARDDHSIGEPIGTNTLSGYYANIALDLWTTLTLPYIRVSYATLGVQFFGGQSTLMHSQIVNCDKGTYFYFTTSNLRNVLACSLNTAATGSSSSTATGRWEHVTLDKVGSLNPSATFKLLLTNCLLVSITNTPNLFDYSGAYNASNSSSTAVFQTVGAGSHYLVAGSSYRNAGTTNINATLATDLTGKTTYAPNTYTNSITNDTTLGIIAGRDTDLPDLGWHAEPIDWCVTAVTVTNATLTVSPGVIVANEGADQGFIMHNGSALIAEGYPTNLIRFVRYNTAQEQAITNWSSSSPGYIVTQTAASVATYPNTRFRFTDWCVPGGEPPTFYGSGGSTSTNAFRDSQFHGGHFDSLKATVYLTNCLFERVAVTASEVSPFDLLAYNNTFYGGSFRNDHTNSGTWRLRNNLFDKTVITSATNTDNTYSGYVTNASRLSPTNVNDVVQNSSTNISFQTSWLGRFYLPTNAVYIDKGNTNADLLTLFHFTCTTNQVKETNSIVDIGFHYVAVNVNGIPIDTDGDGYPDYFEDVNGNGTVDSGETDWQDANDFGLRVRITQPHQ